MSGGTPLSNHSPRPPGQPVHRLVVVGIALALLLVLATLWLHLYLKSLEKPYVEFKGYRIATAERFNSFLRQGDNRARFMRLSDFLRERGVGDVVPSYKLVRQGTDWQDIGEPPFAIPPAGQWHNMVRTLTLLRDEVEPAIGPVEILSAYRTENYNRKAGGATGSKHREFCGLDVIPKSNISRKELVEELRSLHARLGPESNFGLGIYRGLRFHIDTCGYRRW
ncbi:D-Ala-D-Ala carboxypeptidase family metallohydrolase [Microbulbifer thermotolerans]|uniref:D-Ala-D-Ala carboxypeptidase family metallohydrolase n=1 Tax=Microbulbifer thermotolerans TaxID=252514 RepID=A0A143HQR4_MICTH|nr:D-Ala-D-Ala carboxypeptidase family metallohydrolase [Microbulbifer thermotolerans]AMX03760.1 hypothetical protein A3224_15235 [Microbulbifer thermotolerans]MCX2780701.1 D-Ala-D-Ala carboxypeptidase family metallohydrolase [Microbulbifer thermotolerans]MCX2783573.1 D-Ala-D-Ala carboxypeptidase family metallohydrolase [Microbulbifer thermotolerans]MCX2795784.1 D-Ala-D-Ala carboxypeptidase family metallohydrolase [Microbulbifer thermotolerans]MCX2801948.1 D-Ala-D-Ala carboxypeptidase family m